MFFYTFLFLFFILLCVIFLIVFVFSSSFLFLSFSFSSSLFFFVFLWFFSFSIALLYSVLCFLQFISLIVFSFSLYYFAFLFSLYSSFRDFPGRFRFFLLFPFLAFFFSLYSSSYFFFDSFLFLLFKFVFFCFSLLSSLLFSHYLLNCFLFLFFSFTFLSFFSLYSFSHCILLHCFITLYFLYLPSFISSIFSSSLFSLLLSTLAIYFFFYFSFSVTHSSFWYLLLDMDSANRAISSCFYLISSLSFLFFFLLQLECIDGVSFLSFSPTTLLPPPIAVYFFKSQIFWRCQHFITAHIHSCVAPSPPTQWSSEMRRSVHWRRNWRHRHRFGKKILHTIRHSVFVLPYVIFKPVSYLKTVRRGYFSRHSLIGNVLCRIVLSVHEMAVSFSQGL